MFKRPAKPAYERWTDYKPESPLPEPTQQALRKQILIEIAYAARMYNEVVGKIKVPMPGMVKI